MRGVQTKLLDEFSDETRTRVIPFMPGWLLDSRRVAVVVEPSGVTRIPCVGLLCSGKMIWANVSLNDGRYFREKAHRKESCVEGCSGSASSLERVSFATLGPEMLLLSGVLTGCCVLGSVLVMQAPWFTTTVTWHRRAQCCEGNNKGRGAQPVD